MVAVSLLSSTAGAVEVYYAGSAGITRSDTSIAPVRLIDGSTNTVYTGNRKEDLNDIGWSLFAGLKVNDYFGFETGYSNLGDIEIITDFTTPIVLTDKDAVSMDGFNITGFVDFPVTDKIDVIGKAGVFFWAFDEDLTITVPNDEISDSFEHDGTDITFGAGIKYRFQKNFSIRFDWDRYKNLGKTNVDKFSLGIEYNFDIFLER